MNEVVYKEVVRLLMEIGHAQKISNEKVDEYTRTGKKECYADWKAFQSYAVGIANKIQGMFFAVEAIQGVALRYYMSGNGNIYLYENDKIIWQKRYL